MRCRKVVAVPADPFDRPRRLCYLPGSAEEKDQPQGAQASRPVRGLLVAHVGGCGQLHLVPHAGAGRLGRRWPRSSPARWRSVSCRSAGRSRPPRRSIACSGWPTPSSHAGATPPADDGIPHLATEKEQLEAALKELDGSFSGPHGTLHAEAMLVRGSLLLNLDRAAEAVTTYQTLLADNLDGRLHFLAQEGLGYGYERLGSSTRRRRLRQAGQRCRRLAVDRRVLQGPGAVSPGPPRGASKQPGGRGPALSRGAG